MYIIIGLLAVIATTEVLRLWLTHKPTGKAEYFKGKLKGATQMIWDLEFKRFKTAEIREDIRKEYDNAKQRLHALQSQIENFKGKEEDKARLKDNHELLERDIKRFEGQMKGLDLEIAGSKPTAEYPDGVTGIGHQIDSLRELTEMLRDWIKKQ